MFLMQNLNLRVIARSHPIAGLLPSLASEYINRGGGIQAGDCPIRRLPPRARLLRKRSRRAMIPPPKPPKRPGVLLGKVSRT
jgi:hypothetical protein